MFPAGVEGLAVFLLAVAPGFIAVTVWARARTWRGHSGDLRLVLQSLALSAIVQVAASPLTFTLLVPVRDRLADHPVRLAVWLAAVVLVVPGLGGLFLARASDRLFGPPTPTRPGRLGSSIARLWKVASPPTAWDWMFTQRSPDGRFVVIEFRDGNRIAGTFALGSMALTSPEPHGIYLSREWLVNDVGDITVPVADSEGIMVPDLSEVRTVRVLRGADR